TLINCEPSRFLDEIDPKYLELDLIKKQFSSNSSFDNERSQWKSKTSEPVKGDVFSKPKPASAKVKTTSLLSKAHVPTEGFAPEDTSNLQVGQEVEHERFGFGKVLSLEGNKPDI